MSVVLCVAMQVAFGLVIVYEAWMIARIGLPAFLVYGIAGQAIWAVIICLPRIKDLGSAARSEHRFKLAAFVAFQGVRGVVSLPTDPHRRGGVRCSRGVRESSGESGGGRCCHCRTSRVELSLTAGIVAAASAALTVGGADLSVNNIHAKVTGSRTARNPAAAMFSDSGPHSLPRARSEAGRLSRSGTGLPLRVIHDELGVENRSRKRVLRYVRCVDLPVIRVSHVEVICIYSRQNLRARPNSDPPQFLRD